MPPPRPRRTPEEARRAAYKSGVDVGRGRRRREDRLLELRRSRRDGGLFKRRRDESGAAVTAAAASSSPSSSKPEPPPSPDPSSSPPADAATADVPELDDLSGMANGVWSDDTTVQLEATTQFRKLLSADGGSTHMEKVIRTGAFPRFVEFLSRHELPQLQLEAAWALTNIASDTSEYTLLVTESGAVPKLVELLGSPRDDVREQAIWALGNIAADSPSCRELVLDHGALLPLLAQFKEDIKIPMLRTATWTLSNLCFGNMQAKVQMKAILEILGQLIHSADQKILADACWALCYLCDGTDDELQGIIEAGVCPQLVNLLRHASANVLIPVILAVARISAGDDAQVQQYLQILIENGGLYCLVQFLTHNYPKSIRKQACLTVSNITAGSRAHIQSVIDANIISHLIKLLKHAEMDIRREAAWAISNAALGGSNEQIHYLVSQGCLEPLCEVLVARDPDLLYTCLNGLHCILEVGEMEKQLNESGTNEYAQLIQECGGLDILENLQDFDNDTIYKKAIKMLESYWDEEESDDQIFQASRDSTGAAKTLLDATPPSPSSSANEAH